MGRGWDDESANLRNGNDYDLPEGPDTVVEGRVTHVSEDAPQTMKSQTVRPTGRQRAYRPTTSRPLDAPGASGPLRARNSGGLSASSPQRSRPSGPGMSSPQRSRPSGPPTMAGPARSNPSGGPQRSRPSGGLGAQRSLAPQPRRATTYSPAMAQRVPHPGHASHLLAEEDDHEWGDTLLSEPFPMWLTLLIPVAMALVLAGAYGIEVLLTGADWATGALSAAIAGLAMAAIALGVLIMRLIAGRRTFGSVVLGLMLTAFLVGPSLISISQTNAIHASQARADEAQGKWAAAIQEYSFAGQKAPNAPDIARIYTEWGESQLKHQDYAGAAGELAIVVNQYGRSGSILARARADLDTTFIDWISTAPATATNIPYDVAARFFAGYLADPACDTACQAATHPVAAKAYLADAGLQVKPNCSYAVALYETLTKTYADTPEGKQAQKTLTTPVPVSGIVQGAPTNPAVTMYLAPKSNASTQPNLGKYKSAVAANGSYSYAAVAPGVYYPTGFQSSSSQFIYTPWTVTDAQGNKSYLSVTVGPVCAVQIPTLHW